MRTVLAIAVLLAPASLPAATAKKAAAARRPAPVRATPAPAPTPAAEPAICTPLREEYERASKQLAMNDVEGRNARTMAERNLAATKEGNILAQSNITRDNMRASGCPAPAQSPDKYAYALQAINCYNDMLRGRIRYMQTRQLPEAPSTCDQRQWTREQ
jgi:hypothetical protein